MPARTSVIVCLAAAMSFGACGRDSASPPAPAKPPATTSEDARAIARALATRMGPPREGWKVTRDRRGRDVIDLSGRFQSATVVGVAPDGTMRLGCVSSAAAAEALLTGARPGAAHPSGKGAP
jgi:hypothetical protein